MATQNDMDKVIAAGQQLQAAGEGGWPCGEMLVVAAVAFFCFVVLPIMLGMGG